MNALRFGIPLLLVPLTLCGCAGYRFGTRTLYPADVATVYVPIFESDSFRRYLGEWLTEAVIKEIELRTPYKVVGSSRADSVLSGRIVSDSKRVLVENRNDQPRDVEFNLLVEVGWINRRGALIRQMQPLAIPTELVVVQRSGELVPEAGQSITTAQQEAIEALAAQIVSMMEVAW